MPITQYLGACVVPPGLGALMQPHQETLLAGSRRWLTGSRRTREDGACRNYSASDKKDGALLSHRRSSPRNGLMKVHSSDR